jgi:hypothetical protein
MGPAVPVRVICSLTHKAQCIKHYTAAPDDLQLQQPPVVCSARDVDVAIQDVVALLRVPRSLLNITCASKWVAAQPPEESAPACRGLHVCLQCICASPVLVNHRFRSSEQAMHTVICRGAVVGQLHLRDGPLSPWIDLSTTGQWLAFATCGHGTRLCRECQPHHQHSCEWHPAVCSCYTGVGAGSGGKAIPGDLAAIEALSMRCSAR